MKRLDTSSMKKELSRSLLQRCRQLQRNIQGLVAEDAAGQKQIAVMSRDAGELVSFAAQLLDFAGSAASPKTETDS